MSQNNEHPLLRFFKLLWEYHRESSVDFLVAALLIVASSISKQELFWLEVVAIVILAGYLVYVLADTFRAYRATSKDVYSGYSICLDRPVDSYQDAIRNQVATLKLGNPNWSVVTKHFRILDIDWQYYDGSKSPPKTWQNNIADISRHFFRYARLLPRNTSLHIFLLSPAAIALGIGHTIGRNRNWNVYQYLQTDDSYTLLPKYNDHNAGNFEYIDVENSNLEEETEVTIVLSFTYLPKESLLALGEDLILVNYKFPETHIQPEHFYGVAEETAMVINRQLKQGKKVHLYPGLPSTLAFILGSRIDEHAPVSIHNRNYDDGKWENVFSLNQLRLG